jgi:glycosyltransferase involved in cell wall biosynthesis
VPGSAKKIVFDAQAGVSCESEDPQGIAEQIRILYQMPQDERETLGKCGRQAYLEKYTRTIQVQRIENILFQAVELGNT